MGLVKHKLPSTEAVSPVREAERKRQREHIEHALFPCVSTVKLFKKTNRYERLRIAN